MGQFDFKSTAFTVSGFAELDKALDGLTRIQKASALEPLLIKSLEPMSHSAASLAPDDPLTGPPWDLKKSIAVSGRQRSGRARTDRLLGQYDARAYMGPTKYGYPQAVMQEFGTRRMQAHAYLRPAWDGGKDEALHIIQSNYASHVFTVAQRYAVTPPR